MDMAKIFRSACVVLALAAGAVAFDWQGACGDQQLLSCARSFLHTLAHNSSVRLTDSVAIKRVGNESAAADVPAFLRTHVLSVSLGKLLGHPEDTARTITSFFTPADDQPKTGSFLAGFGLGFLAFGLKKLLLPVFLGVQIIKSVLLAMFLPSLLGGLGKLLGKGVTGLASASSSGNNNNNLDDFDFKDNMGYDDAAPAESGFVYPEYQSAGTLPAAAIYNSPSKYKPASKISNGGSGSFNSLYGSKVKQQDYKVFHTIPSSSLLLTNYDPFYSPLLSRLDSVFQQLGYESEACRERLVCAMYSNPAKFAPYSNLVSAQLSRELNELRKPSSDNPEILRFFRYMKAAKNGQDGVDCFKVHPGCVAASPSAPMLKTYNDIDKLVQARRLARAQRL